MPLSLNDAKDFQPISIEETIKFTPKFDSCNHLPVIVTSVDDGEVLMFAFMNQEALALTLETGLAHFWSRSRQKLWKKGETSGNFLCIKEILTDCDQDCLWLKVQIEGAGAACHTGLRSCFYRIVEEGGNFLKKRLK